MSFVFNIQINFICAKGRKNAVNECYFSATREAPATTLTIDENNNNILTVHNQTAALPTKQSQRQKANNVEFKWKAPARQPFNPASTTWLGTLDLEEPLESLLVHFTSYFTDSVFIQFADKTNQYYL